MTGIERRRASMISGLSSRTAVERTTTCASPTFSAVSLGEFDAQRLQPLRDLELFKSEPGHAEAGVDQHLGDTGHADAADADEMYVLNAYET